MTNDDRMNVDRESLPEEGRMKEIERGDTSILLSRVQGRLHACGGKCSHYGAPLAKGRLFGNEVVCPWHHSRFDVTNGRLIAPPALDDLPAHSIQEQPDGAMVQMGPGHEVPIPSGHDDRRVVIVGGGAAGIAAAEMLRREGFAGPIVMITPEQDLPYDRPTLSKGFLGGKATADQLPLRDAAFYEARGIQILRGRRAVRLDPGARSVTTDDGREHRFDFCLLATGGRPRAMTVSGSELPGIFLLRSFADARAIAAAAEKASHALIVGGGFIGIECAASLRQRGLAVDVILREEAPMERIFGARIGRMLQSRHEANGIRFHLRASVRAFLGSGAVSGIELADGARIDGDLVLVGIGVDPAVEYLRDSGLLDNGAVPVDGRLQTPAPGIFAAGDITRVPHAYGRVARQAEGQAQGNAKGQGQGNAKSQAQESNEWRIEHWTVALRQGRHAAASMLGSTRPYDEVPFFWTRQGEMSLKQAGHASHLERIAYRGDVEGGKFLAGIYEQERLRAVIGMGVVSDFQVLELLLREGFDVPFEKFEDPQFSFASLMA